MKKTAITILILLLFSTSSNACSNVSVTDLDSCTINDKLTYLLEKLRSGEEYVFEPRQDINDTRTLFERLSMNNKPTSEEMESELAAWKDSLRPKIQFKEDINSLKYIIRASNLCGFWKPNHEILKRDLIKEMDTVKLDCLKAKEIEVQAEIDAINAKEAQRQMYKNILKDYNCDTVTDDYMKQLCLLNRLKY